MLSHLAADTLEVEGVAAGALVDVGKLRGSFLGPLRARVQPHKHTHIEIDAQRQHLHDICTIWQPYNSQILC